MVRPFLTALGVLLAAAPAFAQTSEEVEKKVLEEANAYRVKKGVGKLALEDKLNATAQAHARAMARADKYGDDDKNGHVMDGKDPSDRVKASGYKFLRMGENVGWNVRQKDPAEVMMKTWVNSESHEKNLANKEFTQTGIGAAKGKSGKWYFVQVFARPAGAQTSVTVTLENQTKETIAFRVGRNEYEMKPGETAKVSHSQNSGKIQIAITWPGSKKEELSDLADKASYVFTKKDKEFAFKKAEPK
jgi:uncharacterized protein YkwD